MLEEVVVTARKRKESAQDVAVTLNVLSSADLAKSKDYRDWSELVPGMTMYEDTSPNRRAGPTAVIRGVSQTGAGQLNEVSAQATTSYTFGQLPIFSSSIGLYDLERIEVLKGPQGTLFGISSMGGTVRYIPSPPLLNRFVGNASLDVSSYDGGGMAHDIRFMANFPLIDDKMALRLTGSRRVSEGYIDTKIVPLTISNPADIKINFGGNVDPRQTSGDSVVHNSNEYEGLGGRAMLLYKPIDRWTMTLTGSFQKNDQKNKQAVDYNDQSKDWVQSRYTLEPQYDELSLFSLESSFDVGFGSIEYVGGYYTRELSETIDFTPIFPLLLNGSGANWFRQALDADGPGGLPPDPIPAATPFPFQTSSRQVSHELRLQGSNKPVFGSSLTFDYVLGAFRMTEKRHGFFNISNPLWNQNRGPNTVPILTDGGVWGITQGGGDYESTAYFADVTLNLTPKFSLSAGVRYSDSSIHSEQYSWGDSQSGLAANGYTEGDDLSGPGTLALSGAGAAGDIKDTSVTPRVSVKYQIDQDRMVYFTAAKGERLPYTGPNPNYWGDITGSSGHHPSCRPLAREVGVEDDALNGTRSDSVWSYDLGLKSLWLDRRLLVNVAVFQLDWKDLQNTLTLSSYNPACLAVIPANVGSVDIRGAELELIYTPIDSVKLNASIGYTNAQVSETILGLKDSLGQQLEKGDAISNVAPWTAAVGAEYRFPLSKLGIFTNSDSTGYVQFDWRYRDERLGQNQGDEASLRADPVMRMFISPAYVLMNFRAGASMGDWHSSVYVNNLANKRAVYGSYRQSWFPNTQMAGISAPRTIGVSLTRVF